MMKVKFNGADHNLDGLRLPLKLNKNGAINERAYYEMLDGLEPMHAERGKAQQHVAPAELEMQCAADVKPLTVVWLWPDRFPRGMLNLVTGDPGVGKTRVLLDLAARITRGDAMPDGAACPQGSVVYISGEDDHARTLVPGHRARMEHLDGGVIEAIRQQVLTPEAIAYTVEKVAEMVERELKKNPEKPKELEAEARKLGKELERFLRLIAEGNAPDSVLVEIRRREERLKEPERERAAFAVAPPAWTPAQIRELCGAGLRRFPELLRGDVPVARQALRKLLPEPLRVAPATITGQRTLRFEGMTVLGPIFDPAHKALASPQG